jgi:hypothetical protein
MGIFGRRASASGQQSLPDVSAAPRQYRSAFTGAAQRMLAVLEQSQLQGRPVDQQPLAHRARVADQFWHFLEHELRERKLGSVGDLRVDPQMNSAAQAVHDWAARGCGIRPGTVACFAWAEVLNQAAQKQHAAANPTEPSWKRRLSAPAHFAAVAESTAGCQPLDGVAQIEGDSLRFLLPGGDREEAFTSRDVRTVHAESDGYRLQVGPPLPYASIVLLAADGGAALEGALRRAGTLGS